MPNKLEKQFVLPELSGRLKEIVRGKMGQQDINNDIATLPPEAQQQVLDFIDFLKIRYKKNLPLKRQPRTKSPMIPLLGSGQVAKT